MWCVPKGVLLRKKLPNALLTRSQLSHLFCKVAWMADELPPYRFPRERGDVPYGINIKRADALKALVYFRDLINAEVFSRAAILGYAGAITLLVEHWMAHPPDEPWKVEKALEVRGKIGRPKRKHREWGEIVAEEEESSKRSD